MTAAKKVPKAGQIFNSRRDKQPVREETPAQRLAREKREATITKVAGKTPETVVKGLATLKLQVNDSIDQLSNRMVAQTQELREVNEAIAAQKAELEAVHGIKVAADSLETLLNAQEEERVRWSQEKADEAKERSREEEEFQYALKRSHQAQKDSLERELTEARETYDDHCRNAGVRLSDRENAVAAQEAEFAALKEQVVTLTKEQEKAVGAAVAIATNSLKKDLSSQFALEKMALQNESTLKTQEIGSLRGQIGALEKSNAELSAKLTAATQSVREIAEKAIEGASKQATNVHVQAAEGASGKR